MLNNQNKLFNDWFKNQPQTTLTHEEQLMLFSWCKAAFDYALTLKGDTK